jgi:hypothetical protein
MISTSPARLRAGARRLGTGLVVGVLTLAVQPLTAGSAHADTYRPLAGFGSIENAPVMAALGNAIQVSGANVLSTYNPATPTTSVQTQASSSCVYPGRMSSTGYTPYGSAGGYAALANEFIIYGSATCVQYARFSYGDQIPFAQNVVGFTDIPYAIDGFTYAVTSSSTLPRSLSLTDLKAIYQCDPSYVGTAPNFSIRPLLPAAGSDTRPLWESAMGISETDVQHGNLPCIDQSSVPGPSDTRTLGNNNLIPFSIANYDAQAAQMTADLRSGAVLGSIDGVAPRKVNPNFPSSFGGYSYAVTLNSTIPRQLSHSDLQSIYHCDPAFVGTAPNYTIHPLLPQAGTATRSAWESAMGITDAQVAAGTYPCVKDTVAGQSLPENDGRTVDPNSLVPFSISAYNAQAGGTTADIRGTTELGMVDGVSPEALNTSFGIQREVMNLIPTASVSTSPYSQVFVGSSSQICSHAALIEQFGYAPDSACGSTSIHLP